MPLEKHLVVHLQELYAAECDFKQYLTNWSGKVHDQRLKSAISHEVEDIDTEVNNLKQCLNIFGAFPQQTTSPVVQALIQEDQTTADLMPNMTGADMDVHLAMTDITFGQMEIGSYQGAINMAKALNRTEVVDILQQNLQSEQQDVQKLQQLLPTLIQHSQAAA